MKNSIKGLITFISGLIILYTIEGYAMIVAAFLIGVLLMYFGIKAFKDKEKISGVLFVVFSLTYVAIGIFFLQLSNTSF